MAISNRNVLSRQEKERQLAELMNRNRAMQVKQNKKTVAPQQPAKRDVKYDGPYAGSVAKNSKALDYESKAKQWDSSGFNVKAVKASSYTDENNKRQGLNYIINENYKLANKGKYNQLDYLNDDEIKTVKHLISTAGEEDYSRAYDYLDSIESVLNERMANSQTAKAGDFARENNLMGAAMSLVTGMAKPLGYLGALEQGIENFAEGKDELIDPNSPYFAGNRVSDALAQGVMEDKSDLAKFLIGTGLSMGNQLMTLPMGAAALPFMGLQGAGDAAMDYAQKGIDTGKALLGATGSGAITYATERMLPNEQLFGLGDNARDVLTEGALKHIFKSALGEGVEEVEENVLGNAWDTALMGEDSEYNRLKNQLMEQGLSESEATLQAAKQLYVNNSIEGFLGGALSGGLMGGMGSGANYIRASRMGRQFNNPETVEGLISEGSDIRAGSRAEMLAAKNREKLDSKGRLSDADVGKQIIANQQAQADMETEQEKINIRLRYREIAGRDADTNVVDSLQKIFSGGALSNNEAEAIINDESGRKMFSEKTGVAIPENATMAQKRRAVKSFAEKVASGVSQPVVIESQNNEADVIDTNVGNTDIAPTRESQPAWPWNNAIVQQESGLKKQIVSDRGVRFGESGRKAFNTAMKGRSGNAMDGAMKEFELYYMAGSAGLGMHSVERRGSLNDGEVYAAYQSGVNDSEFSRKGYERKVAVKNENAGFNYDGSVNIEAVTADNLDKVGKAMGVKITVVEKLTDSQGNAVNGKYDSRKGEFILSADNENGIEFVALHEMVHRLRQQDRKTFYELGKKVMGYMQANNLLTGEVARQARLYGLGKGDINYYDLLEEVVADFIGGEYDLQTVVGMFTDQPKSFVQKVIDLIGEIIDSIKKALGVDVPVDRLEDISRALKDAVRAGVNKKAATGEGDGVIKTDHKKAKTNTGIYEGMSDAERYEILKDKQLTVVNTEGFVLDSELLNKLKVSKGYELTKLFKKLAGDLGITKSYTTKDINFEFIFSKKGAQESVNKTRYHQHESLAKAFHYFKEIVENAVLIEVHENNESHKQDPSLELIYEMVSGYNTEEGFVPVKFTIKDFKGKDSVIYATTVFQTMKKADFSAQTSISKNGQNNAPSASTISLAEIFRNVNKEDSLYQYIPPQFFEDERYSYAGTRAAEPKHSVDMAESFSGFYSPEGVRRETGWFKGGDGKWRFEIDDSEMDWSMSGEYHRNPDIRRYNELFEKRYLQDVELTEDEDKELRALDGALKGVNLSPKKLGDMLHHPELFKQYPDLADLNVRFDNLPGTTEGSYGFGEIVIDRSVRMNKEKLKSVLIHEIQHWIQDYEDFAEGSNSFEWKVKKEGIDSAISIREKAVEKAESQGDTASAEKYRQQIEELKAQKEVLDSRSAFDLYQSTYGEQEARDVQARMNMSAEDRRWNKPFTGDENTVFRFSRRDNMGNQLSAQQQRYFADSKVRDANGALMVVYHQTDADFTQFRTNSTGAGRYDHQMPDGIFTKPGDNDIGLKGKKQMALYANITNPLMFDNRQQAVSYWRKNVDGYSGVIDRIDSLDTEYHQKYEAADLLDDELYITLRQQRRNNQITNEEFHERLENTETKKVLKEWEEKGNQLREQAKQLINEYVSASDYDGLIMENDQGSFGRRVKSIVAFSSNQLKNVTNANPTESEDIRFSMKQPVEETKNLVAVHNLYRENLVKQIELGGFPMPSIAITKADIGHSGYGDVSVIFRKDTIDPAANEDNKVYGADAYTVTFPRIDYRINQKELKKIADELNISPAMLEANVFDSNWESAVNAMGRNMKFVNKFIADKGYTVETVYKDSQPEKHNYLKYYAKDFIVGRNITADQLIYDEAIRNECISTMRESVAGQSKFRKNIVESGVEQLMKTVNTVLEKGEGSILARGVKNRLQKDIDIIKQGGQGVVDVYETESNKKKLVKEKYAEFEQWAKDFAGKVFDRPGVYNGKELYKKNGDRRSFGELHYSYTLENIVRVMRNGDTRQPEEFRFIGTNHIRAAVSEDFNSVDDIKKASYRLENLSPERYAELYDGAKNRYIDLVAEINEKNPKLSSNFLENGDMIGQEIIAAVKKGLTVPKIFGHMKKVFPNFTRTQAERVLELANELKNIPVTYFEAKPQRAVGFDEVAAAIVPDNMNADIRAQLEQQGVRVLEYKAGDEADRLAKLNSIEDVRFSRKRQEEIADDYAGMDVPDSPYSFRGVSRHRVEKQAVKIRKEHGTTIRTSWLTAEISDLYNYIQRGADDTSGEFSFDEAYTRARAIAKEVVDNAVVQTDEYGGEYVEVKNLLKGLNVYVPAADRMDFAGYENYGEFRRKTNSKIKQTNKGTPVDIAYSEMSGLYPGLFPEDITHPAEQLMKLVEVYDNLKTFAVNPYEGYENEVIDALATEIFDNYFTTPQQKRTYADQLEVKLQEQIRKTNHLKEKLERLKAEKEEEIRQLKLLYKKQYSDLKNALKQQEHAAKLQNEILDIAGQFKRWYKGERDAGYLSHPVLDEYIKELGKLKYRSDIRKASARNIFDNLQGFYKEEILGEYYEPMVREYIEFIAENRYTDGKPNVQPLSYEELQYANYVVRAIRKLYQEYDTVIIGGKRERARDLARKEYGILDKYGRSDVKVKFFNYLTNKALTEGLFNAVETRVVYQTLEGFHEEGVLKMLHDDMTAGVTKSNKLRIEMLRSRDEFLQKHKDYRTRLEKEKISFRGVEMTVGQAVTAYLTMHREEAKATLTSTAVGSGFDFKDKKGRVSHIQAVSDVDVAIAELKNLLSKEDLEYAEIAKNIFNEKARNIKVKADMDILGFSNVSDSKWYIPIRRSTDQIAQAFSDVRRMVRDVASVYNFSFNKATVKHTEKAIEIIDINALLDNHCGKVAMYAGLTQPLQAFDRVLNSNIAVDTEGKKHGEQNLRDKLNNMWKSEIKGSAKVGGFENYHKQLMQDVQSRGRGDSSRLVNRVKSNFASAALGANLKEIISQPTGYFMAYQYLSGEAMAKGATMANDYDSMMKYSDYAMVRDYDKGYLLSESLADKVEGFAKKFREPLDWADKYTMGKLWNACRVEVELKQGLKIGTEENYKAAAELLEKVGRLTQPNYDASEKSGLQRNKNEIISSFSMFSSVQTKQLSRIVESVTKYQMFKERAAKEPTETSKNALAAAKEELTRCQAGILMMNVGYVLICSLVKAALPKKEEEKITDAMDLTKKMGSGLIESYVGMIPFADDAANMFIDGYDAGHFFYSAINDMASAIRGMKNVFEDPGKTLYNLAVATGQLTGIPTRNISNVLKGAINRGASALGTKGEYVGNKLIYTAFGGEKKTTYINLLYNALYDGDFDVARYIIDDMVKRGYTKQSIATSLKTLFAQQAVEYWAEGDSENLQKVFEAMSLVGLSQKNISSQIQTRMKKRIVNDKAIVKLAQEISRFRHSDADWQASHRANLQTKIDKLIREYAEKGYNQSVVTAAIESLIE